MADDIPAFDDIPSFDDLPDAPAAHAGAVPRFDDIPAFDDLPETAPEGVLKTMARKGAHALAPAGAGMVGAGLASAGAAALYGAPLGPVGMIGAGAAGMLAGAYLGNKAQDLAKDAVGFNDDEQLKANEEAHPVADWIGGNLPFVGAPGALAGSMGARAVGAGLMGAFDTGMQAYEEGHVDPKRVLGSMAFGAVFPYGNRGTRAAHAAGERMVPGRPNRPADPAAAQAHADVGDPGSAQEQARYKEALDDPEAMRQFAFDEGITEAEAREVAQANYGLKPTIGNPQSAPTRDGGRDGRYKKGATTATTESSLTLGDMDPATRAALDKSLEINALTNDKPTTTIPTRAPDEELPIKTGIEEAMAAKSKAAADVLKRVKGTVKEEGSKFDGAASYPGATPAEQHPEFEAGEAALSHGKPKVKPQEKVETGFADVPKFDDLPATQPESAESIEGSEAPKPPASTDVRKRVSPEAFGQIHGDSILGFDTMQGGKVRLLDGTEMPVRNGNGIWYGKEGSQLDPSVIKEFSNDGKDWYPVKHETPKQSFDELVARNIKGETNPNPSDAQKEAGNYEKARERAFGHEISLEGMKGSKRTGVGPDGKPWESTLPADYGYFRKTIGADKDHVDVYRGTSGDKHFIVDQRDAETGKFDEHKVMTNFKDINDARDTYLKGFSDGNGPARLHDITEVSPYDLNQWLKTASKKRPYGEPIPQKPKAAKERVVVKDMVEKFKAAGDTEKLAKLETATDDQLLAAIEGKRLRKYGTKGGYPVEGLTLEDGSPVTANTKPKAAERTKQHQAVKEWFDTSQKAKTATETNGALLDRLKQGIETARANGFKDKGWKPEFKPKEWMWVAAAQRALREPTPGNIMKFRDAERMLHGDDKAVETYRGGNRVDADTALNRLAGDEAIARAENKAVEGGRNNVEDEANAAIDEKRAAERKLFDTPHEEAESMVKPEPVETADDLRKLNDKTLDLTKPEDAKIAAIDTDKITNNIITQADKRAKVSRTEAEERAWRAREILPLVSRGTPTKPPKSKSSEGRVIALDDPAEIQRILDAANKAYNKKLGMEALPEDHVPEPPKPDPKAVRLEKKADNILKKFGDDKTASLNHHAIAAWMRATSQPVRRWAESRFGRTDNDAGLTIDSILARGVSTQDSLMAEKAHELFEKRYDVWLKTTDAGEQFAFLKELEKHPSGTTHAEYKAAFDRIGLPPEKTSWMASEAEWMRPLFDKMFLEDAKHGSEADYIHGYVPHIFERGQKAAEDYIEQRIKNLGPTWYQKERTFDLLEQAMKQPGVKLKFTNPIELINARWAASVRSNMIVAAARGLHNSGYAFPVKDLPAGLKDKWTFRRNLPDHQQWAFAPQAKSLWMNSFEATGFTELDNELGSMYRTWMQWKRIATPIQLMLGAFHELHIAMNINPVQNLTRAIKLSMFDPKSTGKNFKDFAVQLADPLWALPIDKIGFQLGETLDKMAGRKFSQFPGRQAQHWWQTPPDKLNADGRMWKNLFQEGGISPYQSQEDVIGAKKAFKEALHNFSFGLNGKAMTPTLLQGLRRGIEKIQEPMFKYQIPALKNIAYMRGVAAALKMDPSLVTDHNRRGVVLRALGQDIDSRFGEMFYKSLFWNKYVKDAGIGSFLSLSWNLGQYRQASGAIQNVVGSAARLGGYQGSPMAEAKFKHSDKATFVGTYIGFSMATAGALSYMLSGELPSGLDYIFPRNGLVNDDKSPQRLSTPFNTREFNMAKAHSEQHNSVVGGVAEFIWNKMVLAPLVEIAQNKDFFGDKLYDSNTSWYKKALQTIDSTAGRAFNPISISGAERAGQLGGGAREKALAYAGFNPAPKYVNLSPMENRINHLFGEEGTPFSKPYQYGEKTGLGRGLVQGAIRAAAGDPLKSETRAEGRREISRGAATDNPDLSLEGRRKLVLEGGMTQRTAGRIRPDQEFQYKFARLPVESQLALAREMTAAEFNKLVLTNQNPGMQNITKAKLLKERATSGELPSR